MGEIERNGNGGHACGRKPFIAQIAGGAKGEAAGGNLVVKLRNAPFQFTAFNADFEVANAPSQKFVVLQGNPGRFERSLHRFIVKQLWWEFSWEGNPAVRKLTLEMRNVTRTAGAVRVAEKLA